MNEKSNESSPNKHRNRHTGLWISLIVLAIIMLIPVLIAGWFGFVPGLSSLLGAKQAKDLGVTYTQADYTSYLEKTASEFRPLSEAPNDPNNPGKKVVFDNPKTADNITLTQEELTAAINESNWLWMPLRNTQVRISGGTVEVSGNLNLDHLDEFIGFIGGIDYSREDIENAISWGKRLANNAPVYIKSDVSVKDRHLNMVITEAKIGRFTAPIDIAGQAISAGTTNTLVNTPNFEVVTAAFQDGTLTFSGTYPSTVYVKTE